VVSLPGLELPAPEGVPGLALPFPRFWYVVGGDASRPDTSDTFWPNRSPTSQRLAKGTFCTRLSPYGERLTWRSLRSLRGVAQIAPSSRLADGRHRWGGGGGGFFGVTVT